MNELKNKSKFLRDVWYLTKSYWQSEEKGKGLFAVDGNHSTNFRRSVYAGAVE